MKDIAKRVYKRITYELLYRTRFFRFYKSISKIDRDRPIRCVFFALLDSTWKCDSLYNAMLKNELFEPIILICPIVNYGRDNMLKRIEDCADFFDRKNYKYYKAIDEKTGEYLNVTRFLKPDIIFYTNPYEGLIDPKYYIDKFPNILCCYIPYFYASANADMYFNMRFHHLLWRFYIENDDLKREYQAKSKFDNLKPVGYPIFDDFIVKDNRSNYKTIIWAPHHGVDDSSLYIHNSFLKYYELFFQLAHKYNGFVKFVFRPHPLLKNKLYEHVDWGIEKTDNYFKRWKNTDNCELSETGDYIELFNRSDAMIHDCGSFVTEYIYYNKPGLYTVNNNFTRDTYWQCAIDAKQCYYNGMTPNDLEQFINKVVIEGKDTKKKKREAFIEKYLAPYSNVADKVIYDIITSLNQRKAFID